MIRDRSVRAPTRPVLLKMAPLKTERPPRPPLLRGDYTERIQEALNRRAAEEAREKGEGPLSAARRLRASLAEF